MSSDYKFSGDNWDISFSANDIDFSIDADEVSQNSKIRLQMIAGEQFDDARVGMPWLTDMVSPQVSILAKEQIIRQTILSTPNVLSLDSLNVEVDTVDGSATATFSGTTQTQEFFGGEI
jgi:hypothetical protein